MNTTDNTTVPESDEPRDPNQKTQVQIDKEEHDRLVKAEVSAPISESQVQPGQEVVDGNGLRQTPDVEPTRPDVIVDPNADTQHAREVQDKELDKLNPNSRPTETDTSEE